MNMSTRIVSILLISLLLAPFSSVQAAILYGSNDKSASSKKTMASKSTTDSWLLTYYVGYQNGTLKPKDVDYALMTHIVVGGVGVNPDGTLNEHWHLPNGDGRAMALDVGQRASKAGVKKLIWLGGPNEEDKFLSAASDENRARFVKSILTLLEDIDYDGVDINWEPIRAKDEPYVLKLAQDLRKADPNILITVPVNWVPSSIMFTKNLSLYKDLSPYVDKMFMMSYSMAGPWPGWKSWHGGALGGDSQNTPASIKTSTYAYLRAGVPKDKLGIGIGTYATCWEAPVKRPNQTIPKDFYSRNMHTMSMRTLMDDYYKKKYEKWDNRAKVPYVSSSKPLGEFDCGFISYENERSMEEKVAYMKRMNLGGVLVWNIGTGYYPENRVSKRHPLLKAAWNALQ